MAYKIKGELEIAKGLGLPNLTTVERIAYTPSREGYKVWDTDLDCEFNWNGILWEKVGGFETILVNAPNTQQTIALDDPASNSAFAITVQNNDAGFVFSGQTAIGDIDSNCYSEGDTAIVVPSVRDVPGAPVLVTQSDNEPDTVDWVISPNVTLRRGGTGGFYNTSAGQSSWAGPGPTNTLWRNDTELTPVAFQNAYGGAIGDNILTTEYDNAYITDTVTGTEYGPFNFVGWQQGGGGGFSVQIDTGPATEENIWNVARTSPKVIKPTTTAIRDAPITSIIETGGLAGRFGDGSPIGGQINVTTNSAFDFTPVLMDRLDFTRWIDIAESGDMTITLTGPFGENQVVNYAWANVPSGTTETETETFTPLLINRAEIVINNGTFRAGRIVPRLEANIVDMSSYSGNYGRVSIVNESNTLPLYISGVTGLSSISPKTAYGVVNSTDEWLIESPEAEVDHIFLNIPDDYDVRTVNANIYQSVTISNSSGGVRFITYGSPNDPKIIRLVDGENASFSSNAFSGWQLTSYQAVLIEPTICDINEYIHNMNDFHLTTAHEGDGGSFLTINVNGIPVTYDNLQNASDIGNGRINFNSGVNGVYNRRGSTIETISNIGDYFEIVKPATPQFDSEWISITTDPTQEPNVFSEEYRIFFNESVWQLRDRENNIVANGAPENGTYRIERTTRGIRLFVNGTEVYDSPVRCFNYYPNGRRIEYTGRATTDTAGTVSIVLPNDMPDTTYAINLTAANGTPIFMTYDNDTVSGFDVNSFNIAGTGVSTSFSWTASWSEK